MITKDAWRAVCDSWQRAGSALSVGVEVPYRMDTPDQGRDIFAVAYLPDFGGPRGMVVGLTFRPTYEVDTELKAAAEARGLYCSFVNADVYSQYSEEVFKEALADWGYFGSRDRRPVWLGDLSE